MQERWLLEDQIRHNRRATVGLFVIVFLILAGLVFAVGYVLGAPPLITFPLAVIGGLLYLAMASGFSIPTILKAARARPADVKVREEKLLIYKVEELAIAAGIPVPKVYVTPSRDINAFATGKKPEASVIAVTQGALERLDQEELEGVLAHEMSHIRNQDIRVQTYAIALIGIIAMIAEITLRAMFFGGGRRDAKVHPAVLLVAIVFLILAPVLSRVAYMAISRRREYLADASGAELTRNPGGLARALRKIGGEDLTEQHRGEKTVASLYFTNPFRRVRADSVFATHPPIEDRVARLERM